MTLVRRYEGIVVDSSRWDGLELRPGDTSDDLVDWLHRQSID